MPSSREPVACSGPRRRDLLRAGVLGFLGLGLDDWFRLRASAADRSRPGTPGAELHPDLAGRRAFAHRHLRPQARRAGRRARRVQADRDLGPRPPDQRDLPQPGEDHGPGDPDPQHDLARGRPRPRLASPADRLPALPALVYPSYGSVVSKVREAKRGMLPPYVAIPDGPAFSSSGYLTPGLRPVRRLRRSEPGELPGPEPDAARQGHPGSAAPPQGHGQGA